MLLLILLYNESSPRRRMQLAALSTCLFVVYRFLTEVGASVEEEIVLDATAEHPFVYICVCFFQITPTHNLHHHPEERFTSIPDSMWERWGLREARRCEKKRRRWWWWWNLLHKAATCVVMMDWFVHRGGGVIQYIYSKWCINTLNVLVHYRIEGMHPYSKHYIILTKVLLSTGHTCVIVPVSLAPVNE